MSPEAVRTAFRRQAEWCGNLGSPFTARLCGAFADGLDRSTPLGARILDWQGEPDAMHDSLPLRIAGGLHALVRRGRLPQLAALYPPGPLPEPSALWDVVRASLAEAEGELSPWLDQAPQTNEVARSAVLMAGFLVVAAETGLPLHLLELGASAGLNLVADRYRYHLGSLDCGDPASPLVLAPPWEGGDPPRAELRIADRRGVDLNPLDLSDPTDRERLLAYVWADQAARLARVEAAIALAAADPPPIDRDDAAGWLERQLSATPRAAAVRTVYHSIAYQYFPADTQDRIARAIAQAGAAATREMPLAWLRFETEPGAGTPLRLRLWPGGEDRLLAVSDAHVRAVAWRWEG